MLFSHLEFSFSESNHFKCVLVPGISVHQSQRCQVDACKSVCIDAGMFHGALKSWAKPSLKNKLKFVVLLALGITS